MVNNDADDSLLLLTIDVGLLWAMTDAGDGFLWVKINAGDGLLWVLIDAD